MSAYATLSELRGASIQANALSINSMTDIQACQITAKNHEHPITLVKGLIGKDLILAGKFDQSDYTDSKCERQPIYKLDKNASILVIDERYPKFTVKLIDAFEELKSTPKSQNFDAQIQVDHDKHSLSLKIIAQH